MNTWGDEPPAGARQADNAAPAGLQGRAAWRKALAEHHAALRRGARRRKDGGYRPGMARRPPPDGDDAA